jgi:hypothetical protein
MNDFFILFIVIQIATFPVKADDSTTNWYLYQINNDLGFVVPCELMKVNFSLKIIFNRTEFLVTKISTL